MTITRRQLLATAATASIVGAGAVRAQQSALAGVQALRSKLDGKLVARDDANYESVKLGNTQVHLEGRNPAMIVLPESPNDIARTIEFARNNQLDLSIRSGGHDIFGASTTRTGVVIDVSSLNGIALDAATRRVKVGAGVRAGHLNVAAAPHELVPVLGVVPQVGLGGLALGGGIGWFCGSHGAAVDHVLSVDLVTADGRFVTANEKENQDLYWACRGGGGNFGVVTSFTLDLPRIERVLGGAYMFKSEPGPFLRFWQEFLANNPDHLDVLAIMVAGKAKMVLVLACWSGEIAEGERVFQRLRKFAPHPVQDTIKAQSYADFVVSISPPLDKMSWRGGGLDRLDDQATDKIESVLKPDAPDQSFIVLDHFMHGAICAEPVLNGTPFIRRKGSLLYNISANWSGLLKPEREQWVDATFEAMRPIESEQVYVNYLTHNEEERVRACYGRNCDRLQAIKRKYDPDNVFHNNRNIRPQ